MKNSPLTTFLVAVLAVSALLSVVFCACYVSATREKRRWEGQVEGIKNRNKAVTRLANDAIEYSKHDTNIDSILVWANLKTRSSAASSNKVTAK
jgi:type II secretory pathway component PulJ